MCFFFFHWGLKYNHVLNHYVINTETNKFNANCNYCWPILLRKDWFVCNYKQQEARSSQISFNIFTKSIDYKINQLMINLSHTTGWPLLSLSHSLTHTHFQTHPHTNQWAARPESSILNKQPLNTNEVMDLPPGKELQPLVGPVQAQSGGKYHPLTNVMTE